MSNEKVATRIPNESGFKPLFRCDPPIEGHEHVISSMSEFFTVETYLFPANEQGELKEYDPLKGSQKGILDVEKPFENIGYTVENKAS